MTEPPDLVVPVRMGPPAQPEWLRYAIRTWYHHLPHSRIFVVGHCPSYLNRDVVIHVPSVQAEQRFANVSQHALGYQNQRANIEALLESEVGEDFLWMNDDFFALRDVDQVPLYHRGLLEDYIDWLRNDHGVGFGVYADGLERCLKLLRFWGVEHPINTAVHAPMPVQKSRFVQVMQRAWEDGITDGFMRAIYGGGLEGEFLVDPKLKTHDALPELDWSWVSTTPASWSGRTGDLIRNRYFRSSPYEVT